MLLRSRLTALTAFFLVMAACTGEAVPVFPQTTDSPTVGSTSTTAAVASVATSSPASTSTQPSTTIAEAPQVAFSLTVRDVVLRYSGDTGLGTLEAAVCNEGQDPVTDASATLIAGGVATSPIVLPDLAPMTCFGASDPALDLSDFGVVAPGSISVAVAVQTPAAATETMWELVVEQLTVAPPTDELAVYRECLDRGEDACMGYVTAAPVPGEVLKRSGRLSVIAPEELEELATFSLFDNAACLVPVEAFLGVTGPERVVQRWNPGEVYLAAAAGSTWFREMPYFELENEARVALLDRWPIALAGKCDPTTAHELTHLVIGRAPIPGFLNEGLATFMQEPGRANSAESTYVSCGDDSWTASPPGAGDYEQQFSDIVAFQPGDPELGFYYTAKCFWEYIDGTYGTETLRAIVGEAVLYTDPRYEYCNSFDGQVYFVADIVSPILGFDFSTISGRWGVPADFDACEGV